MLCSMWKFTSAFKKYAIALGTAAVGTGGVVALKQEYDRKQIAKVDMTFGFIFLSICCSC